MDRLRCGILYAWGTSKGSSLPVSPNSIDKSGDCVYPTKVLLPKGHTRTLFRSVCADMGIFAAIDSKFVLWGWGNERSFLPQVPSMLMENISDCSVGSSFIVAIDNYGDVHILGESPLLKKQGAGLPRKVCSLNSAVQVSACNQAFIVLCQDGTVYGCGKAINNGLGHDSSEIAALNLPSARFVALGSRHGAAITNEGSLYVWGDGYSGCLGLGERRSLVSQPVECTFFQAHGLDVVSVACTRGQPDPKRVLKPFSAGQEGPRTHAITSDGALWISGTSHKGLAADHLGKVMTPENDHLSFYRVGGKAQDSENELLVYTGAAEDFLKQGYERCAFRMGLFDLANFGKDGNTHYLETSKIVVSQPAHIHSLAVAADGRLYAWGCGSDGRTGLDAYMRGPGGSKRKLKCYVSTPSVVEALENKRVISACCGRYWSFAIVEDGIQKPSSCSLHENDPKQEPSHIENDLCVQEEGEYFTVTIQETNPSSSSVQIIQEKDSPDDEEECFTENILEKYSG